DGLGMALGDELVDVRAVGRLGDADRGRGRAPALGGLAGDEPRPLAELGEALRVRAQVAAAAVWERDDVGNAAELLGDLERSGLLAFEPVRVERVDERPPAAVDEL